MRRGRWWRSLRSCLGPWLLCGVVSGGCAAPMLAKEESDWMLQQYDAWRSRIGSYASVAKAAYRDSEDPRPPGFSPPIIIAIPDTLGRASTAYVFRTDDAAQKHFIGIEGTRDVKELLIDARAVRREDSGLTISVHPGFDAVARAVYEDLKAQDLLKPRYAVGLTGHSLGGAAALVLAMHLDRHNIVVDEVVTFGQPMVTDDDGVVTFNRLMERTVRVVACDDVIPFLPRFGYKHGGSVFLLLDPARFEFAREDVKRPFAVALLDDLKQIPETGKTFHGHRMGDYVKRLEAPRTAPWRYTKRDPQYCSGR